MGDFSCDSKTQFLVHVPRHPHMGDEAVDTDQSYSFQTWGAAGSPGEHASNKNKQRSPSPSRQSTDRVSRLAKPRDGFGREIIY